MRRKLPWPFIVVITCSFIFGAIWGWKIIRDQAVESGRLEAEAKLHVLAPPGLLSQTLLQEFQKREKIQIEVTVEALPASLLRRALKSAPGQFDMALLYHHQISALRAERKLESLYDARVKFPTTIAPDFRKLPNDRNLMETAPLLWGVLGVATKKEFQGTKPQTAFWPAALIGLEDISVGATSFAARLQSGYTGIDSLEARLKKDLSGVSAAASAPMLVSHGSLAFSPLKEQGLEFSPLKTAVASYYPLWIITAAAIAEGDIERSRKFVKYLLEPASSLALVQGSRAGATTLREQEGLESLPKALQAGFFRTLPIDEIQVERDERLRSTDEVLEQLAQGASLKVVKAPPVPKPAVEKRAAMTAPAKITPSESHDDEVESEEQSTAPSESQPHGD